MHTPTHGRVRVRSGAARRGAAALLSCGALLSAGCGQKGALYLPDSGGEVITRPMQTPAAEPAGQAPVRNDEDVTAPSTVTPAPAPPTPATPPQSSR